MRQSAADRPRLDFRQEKADGRNSRTSACADAAPRFDVDAYYRMAEAGILGDPRRVELIDGEIIDMAAIGSPHAAVTNRLARLFTRALRDDAALVNVQSPVRLDVYNEPEPDIMLLRPAPTTFTARVIRTPPTFSSWSKSRRPPSPTIAASNLRYMQGSAFRRSGSSISWAARSRFIASLRTAPMGRANGSPTDRWRRAHPRSDDRRRRAARLIARSSVPHADSARLSRSPRAGPWARPAL